MPNRTGMGRAAEGSIQSHVAKKSDHLNLKAVGTSMKTPDRSRPPATSSVGSFLAWHRVWSP